MGRTPQGLLRKYFQVLPHSAQQVTVKFTSMSVDPDRTLRSLHQRIDHLFGEEGIQRLRETGIW